MILKGFLFLNRHKSSIDSQSSGESFGAGYNTLFFELLRFHCFIFNNFSKCFSVWFRHCDLCHQ